MFCFFFFLGLLTGSETTGSMQSSSLRVNTHSIYTCSCSRSWYPILFLLLELSGLFFFRRNKRSSLTVHGFIYTERLLVSVSSESYSQSDRTSRWPFSSSFFSVSGFASSQTRWRLFPTLISYELLRLSSDFKESLLSAFSLSLSLLSVTLIVGLCGERRIRTADRDHQDSFLKGTATERRRRKKKRIRNNIAAKTLVKHVVSMCISPQVSPWWDRTQYRPPISCVHANWGAMGLLHTCGSVIHTGTF